MYLTFEAVLVAKRRVVIARLSSEEVKKLEGRHPELAAVGHHGSRQGITIVAPDSVLSAVQLLSERLVRDEDQAAGVLDALTLEAEDGVISMKRPPEVYQAHRGERVPTHEPLGTGAPRRFARH